MIELKPSRTLTDCTVVNDVIMDRPYTLMKFWEVISCMDDVRTGEIYVYSRKYSSPKYTSRSEYVWGHFVKMDFANGKITGSKAQGEVLSTEEYLEVWQSNVMSASALDEWNGRWSFKVTIA